MLSLECQEKPKTGIDEVKEKLAMKAQKEEMLRKAAEVNYNIESTKHSIQTMQSKVVTLDSELKLFTAQCEERIQEEKRKIEEKKKFFKDKKQSILNMISLKENEMKV